MIKIISALSFVGFTFLSIGQTYNSINPKTKHIIDSTYNSLLEKNKVIGTSIAIVHNNEIVYATGYGFQNQSKNIKADENTVYRIGSCTKSFTALSVMQLQEKEKLNINLPIQNYIPNLKMHSRFTDKNNIIIKNVLTHTSGLPGDLMNGFFCDNPPNIDWLISQMNYCTMTAPAGYQHSYSNIGYSLLGKLVENTSKLTYENYLMNNVFKPLGMTSTFVNATPENSVKLSKGYIDGKEIDEVLIRDKAAGLIQSSAVDMGKYLKMYLNNGMGENGQVLTAKSIKEMEANAIANLILTKSTEWGYGLYADSINVATETDTLFTRIIGHGGDTWAFHADFKFIPELNVGVVVLTNTDKGTKMVSASNLLKLYLKTETKTTIKYKKATYKNSSLTESLPKVSELYGRYQLGSMDMIVDNPKKIKLNQKGLKIILKPKNDSLRYTAKVKLLGFIPFKIKHQEFKFVKYADEIYFKVITTKHGDESYVSKKSEVKSISSTWKNTFGDYEVLGDNFECKDCKFVNFEGVTLNISDNNDILTIKMKGKSKDTHTTVKFNEISDTLAVSLGIGRGAGETLRILEDGHIFYNGFEFSKVKEK